MDDLKPVKEALLKILDNNTSKALNYCVNYADYGVFMINAGHPVEDIKVQVLYVLSNMSHWRGSEAKEVRGVLKNFVGIK